MCPDFHALKKITIKDKFPIPVIDDLLDEFPNSTPFMLLRHLFFIRTSNLSSPSTKLFLPPPKNFPFPVESMNIPPLSFQADFLPMFDLIVISFPRRMKLRKLSMNY
jgi:hypothetical protein